jgi:hypothetical protein
MAGNASAPMLEAQNEIFMIFNDFFTIFTTCF